MTVLLIPAMPMWPIVHLERLCLEKKEEHMDGQEPQEIINLDLKLLSIMPVLLLLLHLQAAATTVHWVFHDFLPMDWFVGKHEFVV